MGPKRALAILMMAREGQPIPSAQIEEAHRVSGVRVSQLIDRTHHNCLGKVHEDDEMVEFEPFVA